jgi:hypothetical protein
MTLTARGAAAVLAGTGHTLEELNQLVLDKQPLPRFALPGTLKAHAHVAVDIVHNYVSRRTRYLLEALVVRWRRRCSPSAPSSGPARSTTSDRCDVDQRPGAADLTISLDADRLGLRWQPAINAIGYIATLVSGREVTPLPPISGTEELAP